MASSVRSGEAQIGSTPWPLTRASATAIKTQTLGGGRVLFNRWPPGGRWLSGPILQPSGATRGNALYDLAARAVRQLSDDAISFEMTWMPDDKRVVYFTAGGRLVIQNVATLERHEVAVSLPLPPEEQWDVVASRDGRTLYYGAQQIEANLWKVERPERAR